MSLTCKINYLSDDEGLGKSIETTKCPEKRLGILKLMLDGESYDYIMEELDLSSSKKGFVFETICIILIVTKCFIINKSYQILNGKFHSYPNIPLFKATHWFYF